MKNVGLCSYYDEYNYKSNLSLTPNSEWIGYAIYKLSDYLSKQGYNFYPFPGTNSEIFFDYIIFIETNKNIRNLINLALDNNKNVKILLILAECDAVIKENGSLKNHKLIDYIFTWNKDFLNKEKYIHLHFPTKSNNYLENKLCYFNKKKDKFCCIIATNKFINHPNELYTERVNIIEYCIKNKINLDLYGKGWKNNVPNKFFRKIYKFKGIFGIFLVKIFKLIVKIKFLRKYLSSDVSNIYKGSLDDKKETLSRYKFNICYENVLDYEGYITEKIIDSFICGSIPVYLGAKNISEIIPKECFIDRRSFKTNNELFTYLKNITEKDYNTILNKIYSFIQSTKFLEITEDGFVKTIKNIINCEGKDL
ncbi:glycosyltransferase family 10 domain-containing protein [Pigmentibacter ruber]